MRDSDYLKAQIEEQDWLEKMHTASAGHAQTRADLCRFDHDNYGRNFWLVEMRSQRVIAEKAKAQADTLRAELNKPTLIDPAKVTITVFSSWDAPREEFPFNLAALLEASAGNALLRVRATVSK